MKHISARTEHASHVASKSTCGPPERELDRITPPYLDSLMSSIVVRSPIEPESLITKVHQLTPGLKQRDCPPARESEVWESSSIGNPSRSHLTF
jgi:hypothetical protein